MSRRYGGRDFDRDEETFAGRDDERREENRYAGRDYGFERSRYGRVPDYGSTARGYSAGRDYDDEQTRGGYERGYGSRSYGRDYTPRESGYAGTPSRGFEPGGYGRDYGRRDYTRDYARDYTRDYGRGYERERARGEDEPIRSFDTDYGRTTSRFYGRSGYDYGRDDYEERMGFGGDDERGRRERRGRGDRGWWDRAADEVLSWFGDEDAVRRRRVEKGSEGSFRGRGPKNYRRSDERIRDDINDRLTDNDWIDASDIEVLVAGSEVTLSGKVDSRYAKRIAEDIAESVSGVSNVQNNLRVHDNRAATPATPGATETSIAAPDAGETGRASRAAGGTVK